VKHFVISKLSFFIKSYNNLSKSFTRCWVSNWGHSCAYRAPYHWISQLALGIKLGSQLCLASTLPLNQSVGAGYQTGVTAVP